MKTPTTLDQITLANLQKIAPEVRAFQVVVGEDHAGDPAVKLTVVLSDDVPEEALGRREFARIEDWVRKVIWKEGGYEFYPFVELLRESDMKEFNAA